MHIPNRVKRFVEATNSFCIIMENDEPQFVVAPFEWAERVFIGFAGDEEPEDVHEKDIESANSTISAVAEEERSGGSIPAVENE